MPLVVSSTLTYLTNTTWTPRVGSVSGIVVWVLGSPERSLTNLDVLLRRKVVPSKARISKRRGNYDSAKRLLMERAKTLISTMLSKIVMQTTKTGTDKCKAGLYATLIIKYYKEKFMGKHQEFCRGCKYDNPDDSQYRLPCHRCEMEGDNPSWYFQEEDKRKSIQARWKGVGMGDYECTNCWEVVSGGDKYNFCPWCGAYMKD